jgi:hypothetical protein
MTIDRFKIECNAEEECVKTVEHMNRMERDSGKREEEAKIEESTKKRKGEECMIFKNGPWSHMEHSLFYQTVVKYGWGNWASLIVIMKFPVAIETTT